MLGHMTIIIPISIGVAPTKALAKVANRISKKFPKKTKGVYMIKSEKNRIKALKWLEVENVWGIGFKHSKRLKSFFPIFTTRGWQQH